MNLNDIDEAALIYIIQVRCIGIAKLVAYLWHLL